MAQAPGPQAGADLGLGDCGAVTGQRTRDVIRLSRPHSRPDALCSATMSLHDRLWEEVERDLRRVTSEMRRQMRLMDLQLRQLCQEPPASGLRGPSLRPCCCLRQPDARPGEGTALTARLDVERELDSMQRRLNRMLNSCRDHKVLSLINVKGFDPEEVTVTVKDRKVKVLAEHEEEHTTATGTEYNYRNITKEISLPLGVSEDEVTYSLGPDSVVKIEMARRSHPCVLSR
ncbi:outer dense fiber protein 1 [Buteo buteo]|uniref:outer dense fiber protein 1 n=1 Tax=Buteo buteo TaxID=30397 RepID=UPI003EBFE151